MSLFNFINTSLGAAAGAGLVYFLDILYNKRKNKKENMALLERTKYAIEKIYSNTKQIRDHFNKNNKSENEDYEWMSISEYDNSIFLPKIEVNSLMFLLEFKEKALLDNIFLSHSLNEEVQVVLEKRNIYYKKYIEKIEKYHKNISEDQLKEILGENLILKNKIYTKRLREIVEILLKNLRPCLDKINVFQKSLEDKL